MIVLPGTHGGVLEKKTPRGDGQRGAVVVHVEIRDDHPRGRIDRWLGIEGGHAFEREIIETRIADSARIAIDAFEGNKQPLAIGRCRDGGEVGGFRLITVIGGGGGGKQRLDDSAGAGDRVIVGGEKRHLHPVARIVPIQGVAPLVGGLEQLAGGEGVAGVVGKDTRAVIAHRRIAAAVCSEVGARRLDCLYPADVDPVRCIRKNPRVRSGGVSVEIPVAQRTADEGQHLAGSAGGEHRGIEAQRIGGPGFDDVRTHLANFLAVLERKPPRPVAVIRTVPDHLPTIGKPAKHGGGNRRRTGAAVDLSGWIHERDRRAEQSGNADEESGEDFFHENEGVFFHTSRPARDDHKAIGDSANESNVRGSLSVRLQRDNTKEIKANGTTGSFGIGRMAGSTARISSFPASRSRRDHSPFFFPFPFGLLPAPPFMRSGSGR